MTDTPSTRPQMGDFVLLETLRWWRQLVDANPQDLAPRLDAAIERASLPQPTAGSTGDEQLRFILDKLNRAVPLIEGPVGTKLTESQREGVMLVDSARTKINTLVNRSASTPAQSGLVDEFGWLIETAASQSSAPQYWGGCNGWTVSDADAVRFSRKEDAESAAKSLGEPLSNFRIKEHGWG